MRYTKLLILIFNLLVFSVSAQREYTSSVPKATRSFDAALKFYDSRLNEKALEALDEAIGADPKFIEAHMLKANICKTKKMQNAMKDYNSITLVPKLSMKMHNLRLRIHYLV